MITLPDLHDYKAQLIKKGAPFPLPVVPKANEGLLKKLPAPPAGKTGWPWTEETESSAFYPAENWPKISIVTPSYNQGLFIEETIRSVLLQNYPNIEYIVFDGGSTDHTLEILEKYSPWISFWHSGKDQGQGHAINQGFSLGGGMYYAWLNSDDFYLKDVFLKVIRAFQANAADFVYGYSYNLSPDGRMKLIETFPALDYFLRIPSLSQPACFWSSAIHKPVWEELQCSLDYELWLRMIHGKKKKILKMPLAVAHVHPAAKTSDEKMERAWANDHKLICDPAAHGPVENWDKLVFLKKLFGPVIKLFS